VSETFDPPTSDIKQIALHLPAGWTANAHAAPFCRRSYLVADLCPLQTRVGKVSLTGIALGFEAEVERNIYNLKPSGSEALRLGVPLFGSVSRGGAALVLPVTQRPGDHGLDVAVAGPPREAGGYPVALKQITFRLKGSVRARIKGRPRRRALLTTGVMRARQHGARRIRVRRPASDGHNGQHLHAHGLLTGTMERGHE
jgi:hypothetical protein